jgi:hypothetical protein
MKFIILRENFEIHNTLNKKLFDDNNKLKPEIKDKLIEIADNFVSFIKDEEVPLKVYDYWLVGSNASYNYNKDSDIDVHIIVDMDSDKIVPGLLQLLYNYMKSSFNKNYDIKVKGQDVELYVEDINTSAITNGIYSLQQDKWIKVPKKLTPILTNIEDSPLYKELVKEYNSLKDDDVNNFIDNLYLMRKESLAKDGEFGEGNLIFKEFRNKGYIDELNDRQNKIKSKELSLESLSN